MKTGSKVEVRVHRRFQASAERVFDAWLDVDQARRWLFATAEGEMVRADLDPRVGGRFGFVDRRAGRDVEHVGEYLEIDRPRRLVFKYAVSPELSEYDVVAIDVVALERGCELTLTHAMDARWAEYRDRTEAAWKRMLEQIEATLEAAREGYGTVVAPDTIRFERRLPGPIERVWSYLADSDKRGRWLASGEIELRVGGQVEHVFRNSELAPDDDPPPSKYAHLGEEVRMHGVVTACDPPRLLAYTWPEDNGVDSEVRFELAPSGGEVLLVVTHRRLTMPDLMLGVAAGWHTHLDILADVIAGRTPAGFWRTHGGMEAAYERRFRPPAC